MVKRCSWGTCNSDTRYPERIENVSFLPFPKPKTNYEACVRWIKACGRPSDQFNINKITKDIYVCSKHFIDGRPSTRHPDPVLATEGRTYEGRSIPKNRRYIKIIGKEDISDACDNNKNTQTDEEPYSTLDFLAVTCINRRLEEENRKLKQENKNLKKKIVAIERKINR